MAKGSKSSNLSNDSGFGGALMLKKSLFKLRKPAFLCEINPNDPYFLKIIYYNNEFISNFKLSDKDIVGKNYDFLFSDFDPEYNENHFQYIELLKAVKNFKPVEVFLDIKDAKDKSSIQNYKISFHPNSYKSEYSYCILTFDKKYDASSKSVNALGLGKSKASKDLINNLERKLKNERVLRVISGIVVNDIPLKSIADKITKILCNHLRASRCILYDYSNNSTGFISEYHDHFSNSMIGDGKDSNFDIRAIQKYINFHNHIFKDFNLTKKSNTTLICEDLRRDSKFKVIADICDSFKINSQVAIVTTFDGKINGGLFIHQPNATKWYLGEVEFLEIVAEQFSIAIDRSHSLDKVMEANQKLLEKTLQLRRSLKEEKRMRQMQSEFVAMVSHEFKTPLQIIDGTREVLSRKFKAAAPGDDSVDKFLNKIKSGVSRLNGLIESNLNLSQIEMQSNEMKINRADFSLQDLIKDILDKNSNLALQKNILIRHKISDLPEFYNGDIKLIDHCLTNIIANAVKYSKNNSEVKILGIIQDESVIIKIRDSGIGIPSDDVANIGKKFFRAKNTLAVAGTGIGLYLTKYFVELHNGSVLIESKLNKGTIITIRLPINNHAND